MATDRQGSPAHPPEGHLPVLLGSGSRTCSCMASRNPIRLRFFSHLEQRRCFGGPNCSPSWLTPFCLGTAATRLGTAAAAAPWHTPVQPKPSLDAKPSPAGAAEPRGFTQGQHLRGACCSLGMLEQDGAQQPRTALLWGEQGPDPALRPLARLQSCRRHADGASVGSPGRRRADVLKTLGTP